MSHCPLSKRDLIGLHQTPDGWVRTICGTCNFTGPKAPSISLAKDLFWLNHDLKNKENPVPLPTYEDGYRKGVQDATTVLTLNESMILGSSVGRSAPVQKILDDRQKLLLTKKETKWVILYERADGSGYSFGFKYPSKHQAEQNGTMSNGKLDPTIVGIVPIEVETPTIF